MFCTIYKYPDIYISILCIYLQEKRQKEKEKLQKKIKKKDSKSSGPSQSGFFLEDFPTSSDNPFIPSFVEKCITYIEQEGK